MHDFKQLRLKWLGDVTVQGKWQGTSKWAELLDPLNGEKFIRVPDTSNSESQVCSQLSS
jgi:hypothetical protein